jgi:hypothetical protein
VAAQPCSRDPDLVNSNVIDSVRRHAPGASVLNSEVRKSTPHNHSELRNQTANRAQSLQIDSMSALIFLVEQDPFGKPASTFPDHALVEHDLFGKPASTFPDHALATTSRI